MSFPNIGFRVKFKNRNPDPGICVVTNIDFEKKHLNLAHSCSSGTIYYSCDFDDVEIVNDLKTTAVDTELLDELMILKENAVQLINALQWALDRIQLTDPGLDKEEFVRAFKKANKVLKETKSQHFSLCVLYNHIKCKEKLVDVDSWS